MKSERTEAEEKRQGKVQLTQKGWEALHTKITELHRSGISYLFIADVMCVTENTLRKMRREQDTYRTNLTDLEGIFNIFQHGKMPRVIVPESPTHYEYVLQETAPRGKDTFPFPCELHCFHGREQELQTLRAGFEDGKSRQAVSAMGGMGKTQLALKYALHFGDRYTRILWVHADAEAGIHARYVEIARLLKLVKDPAQEQDRAVRATLRWLRDNRDWLLILDNADTPSLLTPYLPCNPGGHILLTTRAHNLDVFGINAPLRLRTLSKAASLAFFLDRCGRLDASRNERNAAAALARELGCLPLAMTHAAAYIAHKQIDFAYYLKLYEKEALGLLDNPDVPRSANDPPPVRATWELNLRAIEEDIEKDLKEDRKEGRLTGQAGAYAPDLLNFCAFVGPDDISGAFVLTCAKEYCPPLYALVLAARRQDDAEAGEHRTGTRTTRAFGVHEQALYHDLLQPLLAYSLVTKNLDTPPRFSIHRVVQSVIADRLGDARREWQEWAIRAVDAAFPRPEVENWRRCESLLPHALAVGDMARKAGIVTREAGHLLYHLGEYLDAQGHHDEASRYAQAALNVRRRFASKHPCDLAASLHSLGNVCQHQGKWVEAEALYEQSLTIRHQEQPRNEREILHVLNDKSALYNSQGLWQKAKAAYAELLDRAEVIFANDALLGHFRHNMGWACYGEENYLEAILWYRTALTSWKKAAADHLPGHADTWHDLAQCYRKMGLAEAEECYFRALALQQKAHPDGHQKTAVTLFNMGLLYQDTNRRDQAEVFFLKARDMDIKVFGETHSAVAEDLTALAKLYQLMERREEAEEMQRQADVIAGQAAENDPPPDA